MRIEAAPAVVIICLFISGCTIHLPDCEDSKVKQHLENSGSVICVKDKP